MTIALLRKRQLRDLIQIGIDLGLIDDGLSIPNASTAIGSIKGRLSSGLLGVASSHAAGARTGVGEDWKAL